MPRGEFQGRKIQAEGVMSTSKYFTLQSFLIVYFGKVFDFKLTFKGTNPSSVVSGIVGKVNLVMVVRVKA